MINKIKALLVILIVALCTFFLGNLKSVNASAIKLTAGKEISITGLSGNLNNINIKIEFSTSINLDGENNALLIGLVSSDNTLLTDARFINAQATAGVYDENNVAVVFQNPPATIGTKTTSGSTYTYKVETRDFNIVNGSKNIAKLVIVGQKGTEINADVTFTEIKYSVKFGNAEAVNYSYNALIEAPAKNYTYDINGHQETSTWTGNDSSTFVSGTTRATKDITYSGSYGSKQNHNWTNVSEVKATRDKNGTKAYQVCSICGAKRLNSSSTALATENDLKSVHTCNYNVTFDWTNAKSPGSKPTVTYTCTLEGCGYTHTLNASDITITMKSGSKVEPTYSAEGSVVYVASCKYENKSASEEKSYVLPKLTHTMTHHNAVSETCDTNGNIEYWSCSDCNKNFSDEYGVNEVSSVIIPKHHTLTKVDALAPTCDVDGNIEYYHCSKCNKNFSDSNGNTELTSIVDPKHHTLVKVDAKLAKPGEEGNIEYYHCTVCEKNFSDNKGTNEVKNVITTDETHILTYHEAVEHTCDTDGNIEYYSCSHCSKYFADEFGTTEITDIIDPKGHNMVKYPRKEATCEKDGNIEYYHCSKCNKNFRDTNGTLEVDSVVLKAKGHTYNAEGKCSVCGSTNPNKNTSSSGGCLSSLSTTGIISLVALSGLLYKKKKEHQE